MMELCCEMFGRSEGLEVLSEDSTPPTADSPLGSFPFLNGSCDNSLACILSFRSRDRKGTLVAFYSPQSGDLLPHNSSIL